MTTLQEEKKASFIGEFQNWISEYRLIVEQAQGLANRWAALYESEIIETDIPDSVFPNPDKLTSLSSAIANINTIITNYDAGIDTNFERVV